MLWPHLRELSSITIPVLSCMFPLDCSNFRHISKPCYGSSHQTAFKRWPNLFKRDDMPISILLINRYSWLLITRTRCVMSINIKVSMSNWIGCNIRIWIGIHIDRVLVFVSVTILWGQIRATMVKPPLSGKVTVVHVYFDVTLKMLVITCKKIA